MQQRKSKLIFSFEVAPKQNDNRNPCSSRAIFIGSCEQRDNLWTSFWKAKPLYKCKSFKGVRINSVTSIFLSSIFLSDHDLWRHLKDDKMIPFQFPRVKKSRCMTFADCRPQTADCRLQTADCRPQTADCRPQTADHRLQIAN